ncbi:hypothetical protein [Nocardioides piscis]|uniref:Uncharacterized protein n=1 Tax=Nocardioides piscis TaxID=2714938 RepID=A0A6G7YFT7_9ACTN|nr:hypothetical protein [Nocardioides piscis]QIK75682.1 hypothetical protein G7071_09740 [Nocardioides piscis]
MAKNEHPVDWNSVMAARDEMFDAASPHETTIWHEVLGWRAFAERFQTKGADGNFGANVVDWIHKHDSDLPDHLLVAADAIDGLKHVLDTGRVPDYYQETGGDVEGFLRDSARTFASVARRLRAAFDSPS